MLSIFLYISTHSLSGFREIELLPDREFIVKQSNASETRKYLFTQNTGRGNFFHLLTDWSFRSEDTHSSGTHLFPSS